MGEGRGVDGVHGEVDRGVVREGGREGRKVGERGRRMGKGGGKGTKGERGGS